MSDLTTARAPAASLGAGLYESHYLTAVDPAGGRAVWVRQTALKRPGKVARPTVWLTVFDRAAPAPLALRVTGREAVADPGDQWARCDLGSIGPGRARGAIEGAAWDLAWPERGPEVLYLPARWLYDRPMPRSGGLALVAHATVSGRVVRPAGAGTVALAGWDGMAGHNWGAEHAEHWTWIHAGGLGEARDGWLDLILARVRVGPVLTPWLASGAVHLDGATREPGRRGRVHLQRDGESTQATIPMSGGEQLHVTLDAPAASTVRWDYAGPGGDSRDVEHCSVADGLFTLEGRSWSAPARASVEHGRPASTPD